MGSIADKDCEDSTIRVRGNNMKFLQNLTDAGCWAYVIDGQAYATDEEKGLTRRWDFGIMVV